MAKKISAKRIRVIKMLQQRDLLALKIKNLISSIQNRQEKKELKYLAKHLY